jgi:predicted Zn-dependent protease with MMP-like domain
MTWTDKTTPRLAPSLDDFAVLARQTFEALPADFRRRAGDVAFRIDDFADDAVLDDLGVADPFALTGIYEGADHGGLVLYRRPILDEWCERDDVSLGDLIAHVLVDELGGAATVVEASRARSREVWGGVRSPSLADFAEIAGRALANLPPPIKAAVGDVQIRVEEFADDETRDLRRGEGVG